MTKKTYKEKNCLQCGNGFIPYRSTERVCSMTCAIDYAKSKTKKKEEKAWNKHKKEILEGLQPKSYFEKQLEAAVNGIARAIDYGNRCISCDGSGKAQAGHYHSVKANPTIRFNLHNIHIQDYRCNVKESANINGYDLGIRDRDWETSQEIHRFP